MEVLHGHFGAMLGDALANYQLRIDAGSLRQCSAERRGTNRLSAAALLGKGLFALIADGGDSDQSKQDRGRCEQGA